MNTLNLSTLRETQRTPLIPARSGSRLSSPRSLLFPMGLTKGNQLRFLASLLTGLLIQTAAGPVAAVDGVARWTELADSYGEGLANWRTQAIMHRAMHDAMNAALPTFKRWIPPAKDEPFAAGTSADVAMAAAAAQVLNMLHPSRRETTELALEAALAHLRSSPDGQAGFRLGRAIGKAAVEQRDEDGGG